MLKAGDKWSKSPLRFQSRRTQRGNATAFWRRQKEIERGRKSNRTLGPGFAFIAGVDGLATACRQRSSGRGCGRPNAGVGTEGRVRPQITIAFANRARVAFAPKPPSRSPTERGSRSPQSTIAFVERGSRRPKPPSRSPNSSSPARLRLRLKPPRLRARLACAHLELVGAPPAVGGWYPPQPNNLPLGDQADANWLSHHAPLLCGSAFIIYA